MRPLKIDGVYRLLSGKPGYIGCKARVLAQFPGRDPFVTFHGVMLNGRFCGHEVELVDVKVRRETDLKAVCRCSAYDWPHHRGTGQCLARHPAPYCGLCGKSAMVYSPFQQEYRSLCCGSVVFHDAEHEDMAFWPDLEPEVEVTVGAS